MLQTLPPRLHRTPEEVFGNELVAMTVLANQFHALRSKLIECDSHWDSVFNGIDAYDFENPDILDEASRWLRKYKTKQEIN